MAQAKKLRIYLNEGLRKDVEKGVHNFFNILIPAFEKAGFSVDLGKNKRLEREKSENRQGYSLFHLENPFHERALDLRLAYMYPFWRIEKEKWRENYQVALRSFEPATVDEEAARKFFRLWKNKMRSTGWEQAGRKGYVFIALQGRLLDKRHGQVMSPVDMISAVLKQDPRREVLIKLHPHEAYTDQELAAVQAFENNERVVITRADVNTLLSGCDYVVTHTSSVAFKGILHRKPAILFGASDFHHIFQNVGRIGLTAAFRNITVTAPEYEKYFYWFLQENCINAGRDGAGGKILETCRALGWDI